MRRILVYGVCGSGKTMLARQIGQASGIPVIEADRLIWEPGLIPVPAGVQRERLGALAAQEAWVLESAPSAVLDAVLGRADRIIALDYPRWVSFGRLLRRTIRRIRDWAANYPRVIVLRSPRATRGWLRRMGWDGHDGQRAAP